MINPRLVEIIRVNGADWRRHQGTAIYMDHDGWDAIKRELLAVSQPQKPLWPASTDAFALLAGLPVVIDETLALNSFQVRRYTGDTKQVIESGNVEVEADDIETTKADARPDKELRARPTGNTDRNMDSLGSVAYPLPGM